jgi:hypothetical protein
MRHSTGKERISANNQIGKTGRGDKIPPEPPYERRVLVSTGWWEVEGVVHIKHKWSLAIFQQSVKWRRVGSPMHEEYFVGRPAGRIEQEASKTPMPADKGLPRLIPFKADVDVETSPSQQFQVAQHTVSRARDALVADREDPQPPHAPRPARLRSSGVTLAIIVLPD